MHPLWAGHGQRCGAEPAEPAPVGLLDPTCKAAATGGCATGADTSSFMPKNMFSSRNIFVIYLPVVLHKAVAEVSKIGNL